MISILLPVFNAAAYLSDCLQSILDQSDRHWELVAVNDQSTDRSLEILEVFAQKDARIRVFSTQEKGIIPALRLAFAQAQGQLITRMDADDLMATDKLARLRQALETAGSGHVCTNLVKYFSATNVGNGYQKYQDWLNRLSLVATNFTEIYKECVLPSPSWMVYRQDLIACGAFVPNDYPEDYDLCFRFYAQGLKVVSVPKVLHFWRDYPTRTSRTDERYAKPQFLDLKVRYFLQLEYNAARPLFLWGAGRKGKYLAKLLQARDIPFHWICNNPQKTGKHIYGVLLRNFDALAEATQPQLIVAVANPEDQIEIKNYLTLQDLFPLQHYYFFN